MPGFFTRLDSNELRNNIVVYETLLGHEPPDLRMQENPCPIDDEKSHALIVLSESWQ